MKSPEINIRNTVLKKPDVLKFWQRGNIINDQIILRYFLSLVLKLHDVTGTPPSKDRRLHPVPVHQSSYKVLHDRKCTFSNFL